MSNGLKQPYVLYALVHPPEACCFKKQGLYGRHLILRWNLDCTSKLHVERIQNTGSTVQRNAVVLVPLVSRDLRLVHPEPIRQLPLTQATGDAQ